jgi:adenylate cyclase
MSEAARRKPDRQPSAARISTGTVNAHVEETFEEAIVRETLQSERLRLSIIAVLLGVSFLRWIVMAIFFPAQIDEQLGAPIDYRALIVLWGIAFVYELFAVFMVHRALHGKIRPPFFARYVNAFVETSIPTLTLVLGIDATSPAYILAIPITWMYFLFIILSTLRLSFWLCIWTGFVAAAEYLWLAFHYLSAPQTGPIDASLTTPLWQSVRISVLLGSGFLAGVVSLQIRRQFTRALRSVEDRNRVVNMFGQHVSPAVVDQLLNQDVELSGEVREVCVMFLDIQGFTTFAENRRPEEVVEYLNGLFSVMIEIVNRHNGIVNKFLGDGFMAVFGAPISDASACRNGVGSALEMVERVQTMSASGEIAPTFIRIGLHAGEAVTGNVGSRERKEYTIIGDVVNLASRLEQLNKQFGSRLLVSDAVLERLDGHHERATPHGEVVVKGRERPVEVYELA